MFVPYIDGARSATKYERGHVVYYSSLGGKFTFNISKRDLQSIFIERLSHCKIRGWNLIYIHL